MRLLLTAVAILSLVSPAYAQLAPVNDMGVTYGHVHLNVADDGPDITPEDIPHVFERLYLSKRRPGNREPGSGLGLAIVRELVQAMSGTVSAEVTPGGGATLVLSVPSVG